MPLVAHFTPSYSGASQIGARDANDCDTFSSEAKEVVPRFYADVESGVDYAKMVEANGRPSALLTILGGGLIAATLDGLDAIVYYKLANACAVPNLSAHRRRASRPQHIQRRSENRVTRPLPSLLHRDRSGYGFLHGVSALARAVPEALDFWPAVRTLRFSRNAFHRRAALRHSALPFVDARR